jgi:Cytochrome c
MMHCLNSPRRLGCALGVVALSCGAGSFGCGTNSIDGIGPSSMITPGGPPGIVDGPNGTGADGVACGSSGTGGASGVRVMSGARVGTSVPIFQDLVTAAEPPPPLSGGTLVALRDGLTAVAADPDRDRIYVVDVSTFPKLRASIALTPRDEPGRLVQDGAGMVHAVLRRAGALVTIDPAAGKVLMRRSVCAAPRGLAYDPSSDLLHVACAGGELVTWTPTGATPVRTLKIAPDLRDVVVDGPRLMISRFRSAEVMVLDAAGTVVETIRPPSFRNDFVHSGEPFAPGVAWRTVGMPQGGAVMVHQRMLKGKVSTTSGGYGGLSPCDGIVHTSVTKVRSGEKPLAGPAMPGFVLPVDLAASWDGKQIAMIAAGNGHMSFTRKLFVANVDDVTGEWETGCGMDDKHGPSVTSCVGTGPPLAMVSGQPVPCAVDLPAMVEPVSVAFSGLGLVIVQTREPAQLWVLSQLAGTMGTVTLSQESRADTGHVVFHSNSGGGLACASCHPEGHEDGQTWDFQCVGPRRTQDIGGGLSGTEPFHWEGDLADFPNLVATVFVGRMGGPSLTREQTAATLGWINSIPARPGLQPSTDARVGRGKTLFNSPQLGCVSCHAGAAFTNNMTIDVGTSGAFQVPSLRGVGWRPPYIHDGCAPTLAARFSDKSCAGGDKHGQTSQLTPAQTDDLVAFLESL